MPVLGEIGGLTVLAHVVLGQLRDPADQHPEQQDERSPIRRSKGMASSVRHRSKLVDMVALSEELRRFLVRGKRHRQIAGQAAHNTGGEHLFEAAVFPVTLQPSVTSPDATA
jgi:hypothetical protein